MLHNPNLYGDCYHHHNHQHHRQRHSSHDEGDNEKVQKQLVYEQNNSSARALHLLVHFFDVHCATTT